MIRFTICGTLRLRRENGAEVDALLRQPKQTAVLAYLSVRLTKGFQRRDSLLALFWPELDGERARAALSKSVHVLRRQLGEDAVLSRGDAELALDPGRIWCDVPAIENALRANRLEEALALYGGELLEGFHLSKAPEFQQWLERERAGLREHMRAAAMKLADSSRGRGDSAEAIRWLRRAMEITPYEEVPLRQLVQSLAESGDRGGALKAYEDFAHRLRTDLDVEPSEESAAVARRVRELVSAKLTTPAPSFAVAAPITPSPPLTLAAEPLEAHPVKQQLRQDVMLNEAQFRQIIERAVRAEPRASGISLTELQQIAEELNIDRAALDRALQEILRKPSADFQTRIWLKNQIDRLSHLLDDLLPRRWRLLSAIAFGSSMGWVTGAFSPGSELDVPVGIAMVGLTLANSFSRRLGHRFVTFVVETVGMYGAFAVVWSLNYGKVTDDLLTWVGLNTVLSAAWAWFFIRRSSDRGGLPESHGVPRLPVEPPRKDDDAFQRERTTWTARMSPRRWTQYLTFRAVPGLKVGK